MILIEKVAALGSGIKQLQSSLGTLPKGQKADALKFLNSGKKKVKKGPKKKTGRKYGKGYVY